MNNKRNMVIEQQNGKNFLKCILGETDRIDEDCLAAISEEPSADGTQGIPGLIPVIYSQIFQERVFRYDINAYIPLMEYINRITTKEQAGRLFLSIIDTYQKADAYLLDLSYFVLEEELLFVEEETGKAHMILYPVAENGLEADFRGFFCRIMNGIHLSPAYMEFYGKVLYELNQADSFNIIKFRDCLRALMENPASEPRQEVKGEEIVSQPDRQWNIPSIPQEALKQKLPQPTVSHERESQVTPVKPQKKKGLFGLRQVSRKKEEPPKGKDRPGKSRKAEKPQKGAGLFIPLPDEEVTKPSANAFPMTDDEETFGPLVTEDEMDSTSQLTLYHVAEKKYIPVRFFPFDMGREGNGYRVDSSKTKISRRHAEIISTPQGYRVCDCSKLGTFLNGERIPKGEYVLLENGMKLTLKDEDFNVIIS